jgi:PTH1 family peptidyl-tRNA hydrolase
MIEMAAFLGNPGGEYARNRHNAGYLLVPELPFASDLRWQRKFKGRYAALEGSRLLAYRPGPPDSPLQPPPAEGPGVKPPPEKVFFLIPETFMNLSGDSVHAAASFFKIPPERILLVHDELELPLGTVSLKFSGGLGGHNGLRSMKSRFGTADFWRLRIGIGRPDHRDIAGWVLSDFDPHEEPALALALAAASGVLLRALTLGPEPLLGEWSKKRVIP